MQEYEIFYKREGAIIVKAPNEETAREAFYEMDEVELLNNTFVGWEIDDITIVK